MFNQKEENEEQNFWVSYADLMAGLLFVFILLVGAIVVKYVYVQDNLKTTKSDLQKEQNALASTTDALDKKRKALAEIASQLKETEDESLHLSFELAKANNLYEETKENLESSKEIISKLNVDINTKDKDLQLSAKQIKNITKILEDKENSLILLNKNLEEQKNDIKAKNNSLMFNVKEIDKLKDLILGYDLREKNELVVKNELEENIKRSINTIALREGELELLTKKLLEQSKAHQVLVDEFDITKVKIKSLTGIRIKVILALKEKLGNSIQINSKSGAIKFSSNILFEQGEFGLKETSKKGLKKILTKYVHTLLLDDDIKQYIDNITIEGHTDSDGSYLDNMELSQKRAFEVMKFLYSLEFKDKKLLEKYINASGRSYSDLVYKGFVENKNASRRIEIKFRIKNEEAINQLSNYLEKNNEYIKK